MKKLSQHSYSPSQLRTISIFLALILPSILYLMPSQVHAVCQLVCPVVVAGTLTLLEKYGIDNTISGLWIGGALVLTSLITVDWIKKWKSHWGITVATFVLFYATTFIPLWQKHIIGDPAKELWGMDKTLIGVVIGSIFFFLGDYTYAMIKERNGGHAWFPFQKALQPVFPLAVWSVIFYFVTK